MTTLGQDTVLVVGDSIAFSRRHKRQELRDAWPYLLQASRAALVLVRAEGGATSAAVRRQVEMMNSYYAAGPGAAPTFSHAVVQVGIVDCCPRAAPLLVSQFCDRLPRGPWLLQNGLAKPMKALGLEGRPWIPPRAFARNLDAILRGLEALAARVVVLAIAPALNFLPANAPGVVARIRQYNEILRARVQAYAPGPAGRATFCDPWAPAGLQAQGRVMEEMILEDGHHLTKAGHAWVAARLAQEFERPAPGQPAQRING